VASGGDDDRTIQLRRPVRRRRRLLPLVLAAFALLLLGFGAALFWRPAPPAFAIRTGGVAEILATRSDGLTIFSFADNPHILVLDFASLRTQGLMLNRVAALIEKAGLPRDRVLSDAALAEAIRAGGDTMETFYFGHDYSAAELARFFALAAAQGLALNPQEQRLAALARARGWLEPGADGALISLPNAGLNPFIDVAGRDTILHHELSHGAYFTEPAYAGYTQQFWRDTLTPAQRAGFRAFLGSEGYDTGIEDLMMNEMQAYLMHTADPRFCTPAALHLTPAAMAALQAAFLRGMPPGWLRAQTPGTMFDAAAGG
jgi:hypothetical protein